MTSTANSGLRLSKNLPHLKPYRKSNPPGGRPGNEPHFFAPNAPEAVYAPGQLRVRHALQLLLHGLVKRAAGARRVCTALPPARIAEAGPRHQRVSSAPTRVRTCYRHTVAPLLSGRRTEPLSGGNSWTSSRRRPPATDSPAGCKQPCWLISSASASRPPLSWTPMKWRVMPLPRPCANWPLPSKRPVRRCHFHRKVFKASPPCRPSGEAG